MSSPKILLGLLILVVCVSSSPWGLSRNMTSCGPFGCAGEEFCYYGECWPQRGSCSCEADSDCQKINKLDVCKGFHCIGLPTKEHPRGEPRYDCRFEEQTGIVNIPFF